MSFDTLGLCQQLLKKLVEQGYISPSPIQIKAIPAVLSQRDIMAVANTGTGKTAAFALPVIQLLTSGIRPEPRCVRALIITPTRELAAQVAQSIQDYNPYMNIRSAAVFGGVRIEPQIAELIKGIDILIATPGRLIDLYNQQSVNFERLEILVLDEADRMLDLGFVDDVRNIQKLLPSKRQTLMFSATFSTNIKSLAKGMLTNPFLIEVVDPINSQDAIEQKVHPVEKARKSELLIHLIKKHKWRQVLVFIRTKQSADTLVVALNKVGITSESIHANRTQHARTHALDGFKNSDIMVLVATDIAARGIDIQQLPCVVNFDLPYVAEDYVHRIGRTGRAGKCGLAVSFFSEDELKQLKAIERIRGCTFKYEPIHGFVPKKKAPIVLVDDEDEYGNFEADPKPLGRHQSKRRKGRGGK